MDIAFIAGRQLSRAELSSKGGDYQDQRDTLAALLPILINQVIGHFKFWGIATFECLNVCIVECLNA